MSWPRRHRLHSGSVQISADTLIPVRRSNRHARSHVNNIFVQALRLEDEEPEMLAKHWMTIDEWPPMQPLRGVRRVGESEGAVMACNDYLRLEKRSLAKLRQQWQRDYEQGMTCFVPTLDTFKSWSRRFQWQARALLHDAQTQDDLRLKLDQRRTGMETAKKEFQRRASLKCSENLAE